MNQQAISPKVLIVDEDPSVASTLRDLVERKGSFVVVALADDRTSAIAAVEAQEVDLALIDTRLARRCSGYGVAAMLSQLGIKCVFVTGTAPPFPMPEFAVGCVTKPCTLESISAALALAAPLPLGALPIHSIEASAGFDQY